MMSIWHVSYTHKRKQACFLFSLKQNIGKLMENYLFLQGLLIKILTIICYQALKDH